jgi:hypothetical protein
MLRKHRAPARFWLGAFWLSLSWIVMATDAESQNLLKNPGFEQALENHPWMPSHWDTSNAELPSVFFGRDSLAAHGGSYGIHVANVSTRIPIAHNWSQKLLAGPEMWNKDLVFSVWTRSNGLEGRAYVLLQAYRDTISKMALVWGIDREDAARRLNINKVDDPLIDFGWDREYFSESETPWVRREVRVFVPPSTNMIFVRCGITGTGQVMFDDASLTLESARPPAALPANTNLLADPGFEGNGNDWEYSIPPYENMRIERDTTMGHSGKASMRMMGTGGLVQGQAGVCQPIPNRNLVGNRVRLTGYFKTDSLHSVAYLKLFFHTQRGAVQVPGSQRFSGTTNWTKASVEADVPPDTYTMWAWFTYSAPARGILYCDDASLEVIGPSTSADRPKPQPNRTER